MPTFQGPKNFCNDVSILQQLKQRIECLKSKVKKLLKQRLDFPFDRRIETTDRLLTMQGQKSIETTVRFPFVKTIEATDTLPVIKDQRIVETLVIFSI